MPINYVGIQTHYYVNIIQLQFTCQWRKIAEHLFSHHYLSDRVVLLFEQWRKHDSLIPFSVVGIAMAKGAFIIDVTQEGGGCAKIYIKQQV